MFPTRGWTGVMVVALACAAPFAAAGAAPRGEEIYARCLACHALAYDRVGPRHCGLFGRRAGSVRGYDYSNAMRGSGIVWDAATLDRFLAAPTEVVPGTTMGYAGIPDAAERTALIEWLRGASRAAKSCPQHP
ncbi:c-type cytochrome [Aromatoleum sp.]|uniref:c-type cytochrome n=1 Tax=Aromatoleum sp. TaxID=2307007 RepID=UPI002FCC58D9